MIALCSICHGEIPLAQTLDQSKRLATAVITVSPCPTCAGQQLQQAKREALFDHRERLALLVDKCENYLAAASLPMSPLIHVQGLTAGISEIRDVLKGFLKTQKCGGQ